jgi:hypothetical protein
MTRLPSPSRDKGKLLIEGPPDLGSRVAGRRPEGGGLHPEGAGRPGQGDSKPSSTVLIFGELLPARRTVF